MIRCNTQSPTSYSYEKTDGQLKHKSQKKEAAIFKDGVLQSERSISVEKQERSRLKLSRTNELLQF